MISSTYMETYLQKFLQPFKHLEIQLEEITSATNNFDHTHCIGSGGFGKVYKGELSHSDGRSVVAIKRLDRRHGQGTPEFLKEITMLSDYKHENIISLMGFCCERSEMILVYELASRGSLDRYLNSPHLTWSQRLKICLDAAKGISYLHDPRKTHRRLIHCDVKSGNILLDEQWNGKVSDFGLSTMGSANEQHSVIVIPAAGTEGYIDPLYWMMHTLTKESDVYSFGVVLFEVLCGRLYYTLDNKGHVVKEILVPTWIKSYEQNMLNDIIFENPNIEPMHQSVLKRFSGIAYRCLKEFREDRPEMSEIVTELESALYIHELFQNEEVIGKWDEQLHEYQQMIKTAEPPLNYKSEDELMILMSKGVLLNGGKTWFWLNKKGEHCEMISIGECLGLDIVFGSFWKKDNSRFAVGTYQWYAHERLKTHVKTQFLSPGITYTVNLVFKFQFKKESRCDPISLKYRLEGERESSISYLAYEREDGWWAYELYQFTTDQKTVDLQILFEGFDNEDFLLVEGIEFQPLENVEHIDEKQLISDSDSDANWEEKLPVDYEDIMKRSKKYSLRWATKEEAYSIMSKGFLIKKRKRRIWFSLDKNGKKCHMLSAALIWSWKQKVLLPESRFGEAIQWRDYSYINIKTEVQSQLVSSETTYACYLVYKLPKDQSGYKAPVKVEDELYETEDTIWYIYLTSPQTPVIRPKAGQNAHNPLSRPKVKSHPQQRNDGWIEVQIWELRAATTIKMELRLSFVDKRKMNGLIIEGIEFRPI